MSNIKFDVKNLNLHYGKFHALKDVNMEIPEKQITAFIGPSGCGKSTFLKCLNRMNDLVEGCNITGDVKLDGEDIFDGMDGGFSSMGMSLRAMNQYSKGLEEYTDENGHIIYG